MREGGTEREERREAQTGIGSNNLINEKELKELRGK